MLKTNSTKATKLLHLLIFLAILSTVSICKKRNRAHYRYDGKRTSPNPYTKTMCLSIDNTLRARHKTCFLRADTGPCRADILQWYYDVKQKRCYRFFWGGCQGNGNRFETQQQCLEYCYLNISAPRLEIPHFCSLSFDFGTCFGHYNRWAWDKLAKTCKRRLYSGCGGNQNNFESQSECLMTCLSAPNNTLQRYHQFTTCIPFNIDELQ